MNNFLAQQININGTEISGPPSFQINDLADLINKVVTFLIPLAGIILLLVLIWGGYGYLMSQGNPEKIKGAQARITTGIIGFVLLIFAYVIVNLIAKIFGLPLL